MGARFYLRFFLVAFLSYHIARFYLRFFFIASPIFVCGSFLLGFFLIVSPVLPSPLDLALLKLCGAGLA
jgi:hypothetical protein